MRTTDWTAIRAALAGLFVLALSACGSDDDNSPGPAPAAGLFVLNTLGETIDRIDLETGLVESAVATVGQAPNDLAWEAGRGLLWVANSADNEVWRLNGDDLSIAGSTLLGPNQNPYALEPLAGGGMAVTNWLGGNVAILDAAGTVSRRVPVGRTPEGLLHAGGRLYVTAVGYDFPSARYAPGKVYAIADGAALPADSVVVPTNPQAIVLAADANLHVLCTGNYGAYEPSTFGQVRILDPATLDSLGQVDLGGTPGAAVAAGDAVYVSAYFGGLLKYDGRTHQVLRGVDDPILDAPGLSGMAWDAARQRLYIAGFEDDLVYVLDTTADTLITAWPVGDGPIGVVIAE